LEDSALVWQNEYADFTSPAYKFEMANHIKKQQQGSTISERDEYSSISAIKPNLIVTDYNHQPKIPLS
jgi:hypothetical protein